MLRQLAEECFERHDLKRPGVLRLDVRRNFGDVALDDVPVAVLDWIVWILRPVPVVFPKAIFAVDVAPMKQPGIQRKGLSAKASGDVRTVQMPGVVRAERASPSEPKE